MTDDSLIDKHLDRLGGEPAEPVDESWALDLLAKELGPESLEEILDGEGIPDSSLAAPSQAIRHDILDVNANTLSAIEKQKAAHFQKLSQFSSDAERQMNQSSLRWLSRLIMQFSRLNRRKL